MLRKRIIILSIVSSFAFTGCATTGDGFSDAFAQPFISFGNFVSDLTNEIASSVFGQDLNSQDKRAFDQDTKQVLVSGEQQNWQSTDGKNRAVISSVGSSQKSQTGKIERSAKIAKYDNLLVLNQTWRSKGTANLRAAPDTNANKVGLLQKDQTFTALGRTDNQWLAVGRKGVTIGYVFEPLTEPVIDSSVTDQATDLDNITVAQAQSGGFDLDAFEPKEKIVDTVEVKTTCRTLKYDVDSEQNNKSKTVEVCQKADGAWELG